MPNKTTLVGVDWRARLIGKSLTIGSLVVLLGSLYMILVPLLTLRLDTPSVPIGHIAAAVLVATLAVPLRNRLGLAFNRLLHREWQTSQVMLREVGEALSHTISPEGLYTILVDDLPQRLRLQSATLWMLEPPHDRAFVLVSGRDTGIDSRLLLNGAIARRLAREPALPGHPYARLRYRLVAPARAGRAAGSATASRQPP
ncbi:MAG: hypothetical protein U0Z44_02505 [Kouleothrix sp.]